MPTIEKIKKRNGQLVDFDRSKIVSVVEKSFLATRGEAMSAEANSVADQVVRYLDANKTGAAPTVEQVQDIVERALMERMFFDVAKSYIIYRYEHSKIREEKKEQIEKKIEGKQLFIIKRDGSREVFDSEKLRKRILHAGKGYENVINTDSIIAQVRQELYDDIASKDIEEVLTMVVRSFIERDPAYAHVAARLLLDSLYQEVMGHDLEYADFENAHRQSFISSIKKAAEEGFLDPRMLEFDLPTLANAIHIERDDQFRYLGLTTLYTNYFIKDHYTKKRMETPQMFWMRIAMGTALAEKTAQERTKWAIEFYEVMSNMLYTPSSPTLYHAGMVRPQLSSCFLNTVPDDLHAIFKNYSDVAQLLKYAGGQGTDWTPVRATGAIVKSTGVESQGVIPYLKIHNDVTISINRSGRRRGAAAVYLETWHHDIESFLELRKNTGDERLRTHDINTVNWVPDLFMKRVQEDGEWTLFSPDETPDLHDLYGRAFETRYAEYEKMADEGKIRLWRRIKAKDLWRKMVTMLFENGHPWITFKDPSNVRSPQDHVGVVHSSNLCTEITLNTSKDEIAVCNLGSLNLAKFVKQGALGPEFDYEMSARVVPTAMRMLDNVIDINFYAVEDARRSNMRHRPVGLGVRGLQDALYLLGLNFDSEAAVEFSDKSMEAIAYHAILASSQLARERGTYETFKGSKWDRGILPQDTIALLERERGMDVEVPRNERLDWSVVRDSIKQYGMRNSNTLAIAPTATTANIVDCLPTVEPIYKNLYVKSNMAGDFVAVNKYLVEDLKREKLWSREMLEKIKYYDGSIQQIDEIPAEMKQKYKEVFEIDPIWIIRAAAFRGRWLDQSQSLNIFFKGTSGKSLTEVYFAAWRMGIKTTYYLRTLAATNVEKSTIDLVKFLKEKNVGVGSENSLPVSGAGSIPTPGLAEPLVAPVSQRAVSLGAAAMPQNSGNGEQASAPEKEAVEPEIQPASQDEFAPAPLASQPKLTIISGGSTCEACEG